MNAPRPNVNLYVLLQYRQPSSHLHKSCYNCTSSKAGFKLLKDYCQNKTKHNFERDGSRKDRPVAGEWCGEHDVHPAPPTFDGVRNCRQGSAFQFQKTLVSNQFCTRGTALPCPYIAIVAEEVRQPGVAALKIAVATRAKQSTRLAVVKDSLTAAESNTTPATNPPTTAPALSHDGSIARLSAWIPCYVQYFSICKRRGKML